MRATAFVLATLLLGTTESSKPTLSLTVRPMAVNVGKSVSATAQLGGVSANPDFACPEVEWTWGDGSDSVVEGTDCSEPQTPSGTRHLFSSHEYDTVGHYRIEVAVRPKKGDPLKATTSVTVTKDNIHIDTTTQNRPHP
jgi:hypothetical protein